MILIPLAWTDAANEANPLVALVAGCSHFRIEDLMRLAEMIERLKCGKEGVA